jgi:hypothetical protein
MIGSGRSRPGLGAGLVVLSAALASPRPLAARDQPPDGSAGATPGAPQLPGLLRPYAARPPWKVAGVDYRVGLAADARLNDPLTISADGVAIDMTNHLIRVTASNVTLRGYDFSLHGGYGVYIEPGVSDTVIEQSKFTVGVNQVVPIAAEAGAGSLSVLGSTIDGGAAQGHAASDKVWTLINFNGSGRFVAEHNVLADAAADAIDFSNGEISPTIRYNLVEDLGHAPGAHPDFVQFIGNTASDSVIAFNTVYQPQGSGAVDGMEGIQVVAYQGAHPARITSTLVARNTIIAPGPERTMSCSIAIMEGVGNVLDGVRVEDNRLDFRGAYYPFYPPSGSHVVFSGNTDMVTGQPVSAPPLKPAQ